MSKRYGTWKDRYGAPRVARGVNFIPGVPGRECHECYGVGGHFRHCDRAQ